MNKEDLIYNLKNSIDPEERRMAAVQLIDDFEIDDDVITALVFGAIDDDKGVKDITSRALSALKGAQASFAAQILTPFITYKNFDIRNIIGDILSNYKSLAVEPLLDFLKRDDHNLIKIVIDFLGNTGDLTILPIINEYLDNSDLNIVISVIEAIGKLKSRDSIGLLIENFEKDDDLKPFIIESLGKIGGKRAVNFLADNFKNNEDNFLKMACVDALGFCCEDMSICRLLMKELPNIKPELKTLVLKTIYAIAYRLEQYVDLPSEFRQIAYSALKDEDEDIQYAGLLALGNAYDIDDIKPLIEFAVFCNSDFKKKILSNLLNFSSSEIIEKFIHLFVIYVSGTNALFEFFSNINELWNQAKYDNKTVLMETVIKTFLNEFQNSYLVILEIFLVCDKLLALSLLRREFEKGDRGRKDLIIEILSDLNINF